MCIGFKNYVTNSSFLYHKWLMSMKRGTLKFPCSANLIKAKNFITDIKQILKLNYYIFAQYYRIFFPITYNIYESIEFYKLSVIFTSPKVILKIVIMGQKMKENQSFSFIYLFYVTKSFSMDIFPVMVLVVTCLL